MRSQMRDGIKAAIRSKASMFSQVMLIVPAVFGTLAIPELPAQPAYVVSAGITGNGVFGIVNQRTGAFQPIGPGEPDGYFGLARGPHGSLLSLTYTANLVSIEPETGIPTKIGATGLDSCLIPELRDPFLELVA